MKTALITGITVRRFVDAAAKELGLTLAWEGSGQDEKGIVVAVDRSTLREKMSATGNPHAPVALREGDVLVVVDPRYFRPTEVDTLIGDATKAREKLGWCPRVSFENLVREMVDCDLVQAQRDLLCTNQGFKTYGYASE